MVIFVILGTGILIILKLVNWIVKPLNKIAQETEKIKLFNLEETPPIKSRIKEVVRIADAISSMKRGLLSFQKYVPASLGSRLESINKLYGTHIIVSEPVYHILKDKFVLRVIDYVIFFFFFDLISHAVK